LFRDPNLTLAEAPVLAPVDLIIDQEHIQQMNQELDAAAQMELPEGDDEHF
jgi:hypothetical protein